MKIKVKSTKDCGPHCFRNVQVGEPPRVREHHCDCKQCHGKK